MLKWLKKLFARDDVAPTEDAAPSMDVGPDENLFDLYQEVCAGFYCRPGVLLVDHLRAAGYTCALEWFRPDTEDPEPKGMIRAFASMLRDGGVIWDVEDGRFEMYRDGGAPPEHTRQALAEISQAVQLKILLYYEKAEDDFALIEFTPEPE